MGMLQFLDWREVDSASNIVEIFENRAALHPSRMMVSGHNALISWGDMAKAVRGFSTSYGERIKDKDVAVFMSNGAEFLMTYLSVLFCGGRPALFNAAMPRQSGAKLMEELRPEMVFADHPLEFQPDAVIVDASMIKGWVEMDADAPNRCTSGDAPSTYFYSGGTTGSPKRILYTQAQVLHAGARMQCAWPLEEGEVFLLIAPFSHIYGFLAGICLPLQCGGTSVIPERFHPADVIDLIEKEKVSVLGGGPPAIYQAIMAALDLANRDISSLRVCPGGGAGFPADVHRQWYETTGLRIYEGYGMTEGAPISANNEERGFKIGTVGRAVPGVSLRIVDVETGAREMPAGEAGEICIKGPHMMRGYCNNAEETASVVRDGWIHTGDIGTLDEEGFLTITDRKKEMILHKGFNVFPREVEEALISHPAVTGVCVVGAPDDRSGEVVIAYVTLKAGETVSEEDLIEASKQYLVRYKLPSRIEFLDALPLTPAGKLDRMALKTRAKQDIVAA
ncbi:MAG: AMP-binding protein [Thioclava marina]|uniref:class I adenylate-forming enzyme family protein n=1 Tax=Thioclava marina TaxID=1915077 RepID=UPI0019B69D4E|nr:AMP-binding protein [Thioclava marina]MBC7143928.1 AMP-binding protein [Thioclava marina]